MKGLEVTGIWKNFDDFSKYTISVHMEAFITYKIYGSMGEGLFLFYPPTFKAWGWGGGSTSLVPAHPSAVHGKSTFQT